MKVWRDFWRLFLCCHFRNCCQ